MYILLQQNLLISYDVIVDGGESGNVLAIRKKTRKMQVDSN